MKARADAIETALGQIEGIEEYLNDKTILDLPFTLEGEGLPQLLAPGSYDSRGGFLIATDTRLLFIGNRKSIRAEFLYESITSVESRTGILLGKVTIHTNGEKIEINNIPNQHVPSMGDLTRNKLAEATLPLHSQASPSPPAAALYIADELGKLAELRDRGILTDSEFDAQKAKLLSQ